MRAFAWLLVTLGLAGVFLATGLSVVLFTPAVVILAVGALFALGVVVLAIRRPAPDGRRCPFCAEVVHLLLVVKEAAVAGQLR